MTPVNLRFWPTPTVILAHAALSEHVAVAVGGGDVVLRHPEDSYSQSVAVEVDVGDVDVVGALDSGGEVLAGEPTLEVEQDGRSRREQEHGKLVRVAILDVCVDALVNDRHHALGADLEEQVAHDAIDGPAVAADLRALGTEEGDGSAIGFVVDTVELGGGHVDDSLLVLGGVASRTASVCFPIHTR